MEIIQVSFFVPDSVWPFIKIEIARKVCGCKTSKLNANAKS